MENNFSKYFLAANSAEGFVSHFEDNYDFTDGWRAYIIKGGPGTGKSSFMKYILVKAIDNGYSVELFPCSSDPDSLDGVIIKEKKIIILDGTAPHVVEPKIPGVCEEIINLGQFWNNEKLRSKAQEIITVTNENKKLHKTASAYISAAGELICDNFKLSKRFINLKKAEHYGLKLANRLIPKSKTNTPKEWVRFIGGVTPKGVVAFKRTVEDFYKNIIVIDDKYGGAANEIMNAIRKIALTRGYEIITLKNPFLPSEITDHMLIPELSLAFVREYEYMHFSESHRRIHARRFFDVNVLRECRSRLTFNRRLTRELLLGAIETLTQAKSIHDKLEKYYIDAMNFKTMTLFAEQKAKEILIHNA
ncbi:MAG: hypothetical protein IKU82_04300 [Clostridia bacterium]|nr:hypothetical protein [Clostridia bacterium]